jgi:type II secretion system protein N
MAWRPSKRIKLIGYIALGIGSFFFFLYAHFFVIGDAPAETILAPRLIEQAQGVKITYDKDRIRGDLFGGISFYDLEVHPETRDGMLAGNEEPFLVIDRLRVRVKPLRLLMGRLGLGIHAELYDGEIDADVSASSKEVKVKATSEGVDLGLHTFLPNTVGLVPEGKLDGTVDLLIPLVAGRGGQPAPDPSKSRGSISLKLSQAGLAESNVMGMQKIPPTPFDDAGVVVTIEEGKVELKKVGFEGSELTVLVDGDLSLRPNFALSIMNGKLDLRMSQGFENQLDSLAKMALQQGRQADGQYAYRLQGPLRSLKPRPIRGSSRRSRR